MLEVRWFQKRLGIFPLVKEVNDAAVGFPILWNQTPLNQVFNCILEKSWDWLDAAFLEFIIVFLYLPKNGNPELN